MEKGVAFPEATRHDTIVQNKLLAEHQEPARVGLRYMLVEPVVPGPRPIIVGNITRVRARRGRQMRHCRLPGEGLGVYIEQVRIDCDYRSRDDQEACERCR